MIPQLLAAVVGVELMVAPGFLDMSDIAASSFRAAGPVITSVGFLSAFPILRGLRFVNVVPSAWLILAPLATDHSTAAAMNSVLAGVVVAALAVVAGPGEGRKRYGGGWQAVFRG